MGKTTIFLALSIIVVMSSCYKTSKEVRKEKNAIQKETWWGRNVLGQKKSEIKEKEFNVAKAKKMSIMQLIEHLAPRYLLLAHLLIFGVILLVGLYSVMHHFIRKIPLPLFAIMV